MRARIRGAVRGQAYTVRWRVVSADGHVGTGVFTFGVGVTPPPPTEAVGASGVTWRDDVARWALFASLALMIGVVGIRLLVLPRGRRPAGRAARLPSRHARRVSRAQHGHRGIRDPLGERAPGVGRRPPLRRPVAVRGVDALRERVPRDDLRVRDLPHDPRRSRGRWTRRSSAGRPSCSRSCSSGATRSRAPGERSRTRRRSPRSRTGCISSRRCSGSAVS